MPAPMPAPEVNNINQVVPESVSDSEESVSGSEYSLENQENLQSTIPEIPVNNVSLPMTSTEPQSVNNNNNNNNNNSFNGGRNHYVQSTNKKAKTHRHHKRRNRHQTLRAFTK